MAFGGLKGTVSGGANAIPSGGAMAATGSVSVSVGDLLYCVVSERGAITVTGVTDSLGHTYTAKSAGSGTTAATRIFWKIATAAGTLTSMTGSGTASNDDFAVAGAVFEGPFAASPLDVSPADNTADGISPYNGPATGTLAQASELVICSHSGSPVRVTLATSPNLLAVAAASAGTGTANSINACIGYQVVSDTSSITPEFTQTVSAGNTVQTTMSFKELVATISISLMPLSNKLSKFIKAGPISMRYPPVAKSELTMPPYRPR